MLARNSPTIWTPNESLDLYASNGYHERRGFFRRDAVDQARIEAERKKRELEEKQRREKLALAKAEFEQRVAREKLAVQIQIEQLQKDGVGIVLISPNSRVVQIGNETFHEGESFNNIRVAKINDNGSIVLESVYTPPVFTPPVFEPEID